MGLLPICRGARRVFLVCFMAAAINSQRSIWIRNSRHYKHDSSLPLSQKYSFDPLVTQFTTTQAIPKRCISFFSFHKTTYFQRGVFSKCIMPPSIQWQIFYFAILFSPFPTHKPVRSPTVCHPHDSRSCFLLGTVGSLSQLQLLLFPSIIFSCSIIILDDFYETPLILRALFCKTIFNFIPTSPALSNGLFLWGVGPNYMIFCFLPCFYKTYSYLPLHMKP
jgi:hypothetical protein